jgi:hypothetical protein
MFVKQPAHEKRRLLDFVVSNCSWKDGQLTPTFRQPFDMLAVAVAQNLGSETLSKFPSAKNENWLPSLDAFRTFAAKGFELGTLFCASSPVSAGLRGTSEI